MVASSIDSVVEIIRRTPPQSAERMRLRREESNIILVLRAQQGATPRSATPANQNLGTHQCPSQGSHGFIGMRRSAQLDDGFENERLESGVDNCWKRHRKTPWRRTPILTQMGQFIGYEQ